MIPSAQIQSAFGLTGLAADVAELRGFVGCGRCTVDFVCVFAGVLDCEKDCACECDANHATFIKHDNKMHASFVFLLLTTALPSLSVSKFRSHGKDVANSTRSMQEEWFANALVALVPGLAWNANRRMLWLVMCQLQSLRRQEPQRPRVPGRAWIQNKIFRHHMSN